jgi:glycine cleavage system H protein
MQSQPSRSYSPLDDEYGGETILVGRPGFKPGGWRQALLGGFDSHSPPPSKGLAKTVLIAGFEFPDDLYYLVEQQVWARLDSESTATVGITALGSYWAGELYMCRGKDVGTSVEQGRSIAVVELAKSIVSVKSPVSGTVVAINEALGSDPDRVRSDPYGDGWLAVVQLSDWISDVRQLRTMPEAADAMQTYASAMASEHRP